MLFDDHYFVIKFWMDCEAFYMKPTLIQETVKKMTVTVMKMGWNYSEKQIHTRTSL